MERYNEPGNSKDVFPKGILLEFLDKNKVVKSWIKAESAVRDDKIKKIIAKGNVTCYDNENKKIEEEFGDILITIVNLSRFLNLDLTDTLNKSYMKFKKRVDRMEKEAKKKNINLEKLNIYELDKLSEKSKK